MFILSLIFQFVSIITKKVDKLGGDIKDILSFNLYAN